MPVNARKKILFIGHESSLTGAPILLLNLLELIKRHSLYDFEIVLARGGALDEAFQKLAPTDILKGKNYSTTRNKVKRFVNSAERKLKLLKWRNKVRKFDLIFSNTVVNGKVLKGFTNSGRPVVSYIHELETIIQENYADAVLTFQLSDIISVPSAAVSNNLRLAHSIREQKIKRLDYFFPMKDLAPSAAKKKEVRQNFLDQFKLPKDKFYVVAMGTATHRKGIDLFLELCKELQAEPDVFFVWIGDFVDPGTKEKALKYIEAHSLSDNFFMTGFLPNSPLNLLSFDLFCLTSREDPYPLVVIEAALQKIPALCFNSGGMTEFIADGCGWLINDFSSQAMAKKILELKKDKKQIEMVGENAYQKAIALHSDEKRILSQFNTIINLALAKEEGTGQGKEG